MLYSFTNSIRNGGSGQEATAVLEMDLKSLAKASAMLLLSVTIWSQSHNSEQLNKARPVRKADNIVAICVPTV